MKKFLTSLLCVMMVVCFMPGLAWADGDAADPNNTVVAKIGNAEYSTLADAVAAAESGATIELLADCSGCGIGLFANPTAESGKTKVKDLTIDFGGFTYTCTGPGVGSMGTESQAFHLEKGCKITLKNGTLKIANVTGVSMGIQNYCDLTLEDFNIDASANASCGYALSNNNGDIYITGNSSITAYSGKKAFDVCVTEYYPEGARVTVDTTGTINGVIEYGTWGNKPDENKTFLKIINGTFNGTFSVESGLEDDAAAKVSISGGSFTVEDNGFAKYVVEGMKMDNGKVVIDAETAVASVNGVGYTTLQDAIDAAQPGSVVTLLKDIDTGSNNAGNTQGAFRITKSIIIDGNQKTIKADETEFTTTASMFNIENGAEVTFRNLTIDGNEKAKHGLNIYTNASAETMSSVKVENVTIQNCTGYGIVCNGSKLTVDGITTTGNGWGGINVDTRSGGYTEAELVFNKGTINEDNSIYFENTAKTADNANTVNGTINNGTFNGAVYVKDETDGTDVDGVTLVIKGGTYKAGIEEQYLAPGLIVNGNGTVTTPYIPPTTTAQKPVIEPNADVMTSLSADGTTLTIKAKDGYEITDVTVNGVSKGAVDKVTGLKTGDKVVISTKKSENPDDTAAQIEAVKAIQLVARSANAKAPSGKKAIKVTWFEKNGKELNLDGYEIYRSTKKNSGYGTKPIYKTTKSLQYFNTSAKKGTRYYYKVRGYKEIGGEKVYTSYSLKAIRTAK